MSDWPRFVWRLVAVAATIVAPSTLSAQAPPGEPAPASPGYLGVIAVDSPADSGAALAEVMANAPAGAAGLRPGDVVVAVDGQPVRAAREMISMLSQYEPGQSATMTVRRDGFTRDIVVTLGDRPSAPQRRFPEFGRVARPWSMQDWRLAPRPDSLLEDRTPPEQRLGLHILPASPAALARRGLPDRAGVLVCRVERDSPADLAGLKIGALIVAIDGAPVASRQAFSKAMSRTSESVEFAYFLGTEQYSATMGPGQ